MSLFCKKSYIVVGGVTKSSSSSLNICLLQAMKTGDGEGLGMVLHLELPTVLHNSGSYKCLNTTKGVPQTAYRQSVINYSLLWKMQLRSWWEQQSDFIRTKCGNVPCGQCIVHMQEENHILTALLSPTTSCNCQQCFEYQFSQQVLSKNPRNKHSLGAHCVGVSKYTARG